MVSNLQFSNVLSRISSLFLIVCIWFKAHPHYGWRGPWFDSRSRQTSFWCIATPSMIIFHTEFCTKTEEEEFSPLSSDSSENAVSGIERHCVSTCMSKPVKHW